ncbi:MAG: class II aldolase/adducin family protein [Pseudomonadota bacterium]
MTVPNLVTVEFRALSATLGKDPLQVQGPGGNTSIKDGSVMFIKASGTELADAEDKEIFVAVDRDAAVLEAKEEVGDGSCKDTVLEKSNPLRPSIETTFHAAFDHRVVAHTHSVSTIAHAISPQGRKAATEKLTGLPFAMVPYAKPGLPLTRQILGRVTSETQVVVLQNHGLICAGETVDEVRGLLAEVEARLTLSAREMASTQGQDQPPAGFEWSDYGWLALDEPTAGLVLSGTYYPDHVVFLGPGLPVEDHNGNPPAILKRGQGVLIRSAATSAQKAMLRCLSDVFSRIPEGWSVDPIGAAAEAELMNWDAEKYRQALASGS